MTTDEPLINEKAGVFYIPASGSCESEAQQLPYSARIMLQIYYFFPILSTSHPKIIKSMPGSFQKAGLAIQFSGIVSALTFIPTA